MNELHAAADVRPSQMSEPAVIASTKAPHGSGAFSQGLEEAREEGDVRDERIDRARAGERAAFDALLADLRPRALATALKVLRNPDDAEDAVQEAFVKIWRSFSRFEGRASLTTWSHRIVVNACLDLLRRQACRPGALVAEEGNDGEERRLPEPAHEETPEVALVRAETSNTVRGALALLSPVHREALTLREFDDCSYDEIALAARCPVGTVMSRLHHARKRLAEELRFVCPNMPAEPYERLAA